MCHDASIDLSQFTLSQHCCIFRNSCKGSLIMFSLHVQSIVIKPIIMGIPDIPIPVND